MNTMQQLIDFLERLRSENIYYSLQSVRDAIMVVVPTPGEYYEIEFFADGHIEVQTFGPAGDVEDVTVDQITTTIIKQLR